MNIFKSPKTTVMFGVLLSMLLAALDQTIIATAMPKIAGEFNGLENLSWIFTAYMLASTVSVPIYGKLSDLYGRKIFFIGGIIVFLAGSVLSGMSQNMAELIIFRALQGLGAGAIMVNAFAIIGDLFSPRERGKWQGIIGGVFALSSVIGPVLGGFLTDHISWRWNFYINIPLGMIALAVIWRFMPKIVSDLKKKSIDYIGAASLALFLTPLLLISVWGGNQYAWGSAQILGLGAVMILSSAIFIIAERKAEEPIIFLGLFRNSIFLVSVLISFLSAIGMFGAIFYIPLFAQTVLGFSAVNSGTVLTPLTLSIVFSSIISGQIISRTGKYKWLAVFGMFISMVAVFWLSRLTPSVTQAGLFIRMIVTGIGLGIAIPIFNIVVQNAFERSKLGVVTASLQLFRSIGGTIGVAVMGSIVNHALIGKIALDAEQMKNNFTFAIDKAFMISFFVTALAFIVSFFLKETVLRKTEKPMLEGIGQEFDAELGQALPKDEPDLTK